MSANNHMRSTSLTIITFAAVSCSTIHANTEKAPLSLSELQKSDLIVVGSIRRIRIESERSRFENAFGNYDWGIYVTLAIENVEKGQLADTEIEFRCFRVKSRRRAMEYFSPSGHRPIPSIGTRVRVYLYGEKQKWSAALPNGITPPEANDDESVWPDGRLTDAAEISDLRSLLYTYILPLELWGILIFTAGPVAIGAIIFTRKFRRRTPEVPNATGKNAGPDGE